MHYQASLHRYEAMEYRRCGNSGLLLPALSLGLWHNFGDIDSQANARAILRLAFDKGITHFDLANNYGPPPGSAESNFGKIFKEDFLPYRDELIISTKAGWKMWDGPYGDYGSKKYLTASLDQSLKRMGLDYVDIFYHHRPDPNTPLEETMAALHLMVQQGKALYVGISSYPPAEAEKAFQLLQQIGTHCLIHQPRYSMLDRWVEDGLLDVLEKNGVGCIAFSPLAQGVLTNKYLNGIPVDSRAASHRGNGAIEENVITPQLIQKLNALNAIAGKRNQSLAQMALAWVLKDKRITSVLIGVSKAEQLTDSLMALNNYTFSQEELQNIASILSA
ncbi:MAG: L-glyceraldehyde 3-phosphate reductase [Hydrotalea flava]|uniref:L-glyceraldehyde 3-phosphate reductase n=1 Tax=Hydrotalea TaxID=1004300 RepID=UPI0016A3A155|nr:MULTISPECIES: L-glyceraldehyde 3-phosphate reductase [Hydrotalea]MBY0347052.1 L-glyceraldehyde 3-phosphate reductase [Hydrotalea flava]NIM35805.1 L-glyceraldehyde 3-phosphate reductase [Hydrotalea flava]NIM38657.1 L-glyceraldehyde 3-phosphate reductase [Hydrotalea flava]NIN03845.1 L-glyceraldehyde 3-phosphate reductase [Hydrotalea flava]NIN15566.1 L-glyceraldehyde 3-phosphate reductase [Hydrotalea flava]